MGYLTHSFQSLIVEQSSTLIVPQGYTPRAVRLHSLSREASFQYDNLGIYGIVITRTVLSYSAPCLSMPIPNFCKKLVGRLDARLTEVERPYFSLNKGPSGSTKKL